MVAVIKCCKALCDSMPVYSAVGKARVSPLLLACRTEPTREDRPGAVQQRGVGRLGGLGGVQRDERKAVTGRGRLDQAQKGDRINSPGVHHTKSFLGPIH